MATNRTHTCAVCPRPIGTGWLMCPPHWRAVPRELQRAVTRAWGAHQRAKGPHERLGALAPYRKARDAAIASVAEPSGAEQ